MKAPLTPARKKVPRTCKQCGRTDVRFYRKNEVCDSCIREALVRFGRISP